MQGRSSLPGEKSLAGDRENEGNTSSGLFAWGLFAFQIFPLVLQWELNEQMQPHEAMDTAQLAIRHNTHFMQDGWFNLLWNWMQPEHLKKFQTLQQPRSTIQIPAKDLREAVDSTWCLPCCSGYQQHPAERGYQWLRLTSTGIFFCPNNFLSSSKFYTIKTTQVQYPWWQRSWNYQGIIGCPSVCSQHVCFSVLLQAVYSVFFFLFLHFFFLTKFSAPAKASLDIRNKSSMVSWYSDQVSYLVHMKYPTCSETEDVTQTIYPWACPEEATDKTWSSGPAVAWKILRKVCNKSSGSSPNRLGMGLRSWGNSAVWQNPCQWVAA